MILNNNILDELSEKIREEVRTPAGATILALELGKIYKEAAPSVNTIKRMVGLLPEGNPRRTTLNILANYLGFPDWEMLEADTMPQSSAFGAKDIFINMTELDDDIEVEIAWKPGRTLLLRHDGSGRYTVMKSENCKLLPGDHLSLSTLAIGYPFVADKVFRDDKPLGNYRGADGSALHLLNILRN